MAYNGGPFTYYGVLEKLRELSEKKQMTETFRILNSKGVQSAVLTITSKEIKVTEDNTFIITNGVSPTGIFKAAMGYTIELVQPPLATTS